MRICPVAVEQSTVADHCLGDVAVEIEGRCNGERCRRLHTIVMGYAYANTLNFEPTLDELPRFYDASWK